MLGAKLTPSASLLYCWILRHSAGDRPLTVDLQDFQAWTEEYRDKPCSDREISSALQQLKERKLIHLARTEVTLDVNLSETADEIALPSARILFSDNDKIFLNRQRHRSHGFFLVCLAILASFAFGLIPIVAGIVSLPVSETNPINTWSILGEKEN